MRISGLASGIDTESIINDMMKAHRLPLNKITQKKQFLEWQLNDYRSVNRDVRSMREGLFDMTLQKTFMQKTVNVSNENAVSIRSLNANSEFSGQIKIEQLATAATWNSGDNNHLELENGKAKSSTKINDLKNDSWLKVGETVTITAPNEEGIETSVEINIEEGDTINSVISKINKQSGVNAFFDEHSGKIAMTAKNTGLGDIKVETISGDAVATEIVGISEGQTTAVSGENAKFTFNGLETERSSNTFEINGFEITLKETTTSPVTFNSTPDVDKVFDSVMEFVNDYNDMIKKLNDKIKEPIHRTFHPLSAEEKADMKEKEIEQWEEKAMSGTLRNDPTIQSLLSNMRMAMTSSVTTSDGESIRLSDIGIKPTNDYLSNGKLEVDEAKLREAIAADPGKVHELFSKNVDGENGKGIAVQMRSSLEAANKTITNRAGNAGSTNESFTLGRNLKEMDNQILRFEDRLQKMEERYWKQFSAMETAMNRANAQMEQLQNALGGLMM